MSVGVGDVRKTLEFIVKTTKVRYRFEWKKLKGLHATKKSWNMHSFKSGIVNRRGQYVVCGQAKRKSIRHEGLCKKLAGLNGQICMLRVKLKGTVIMPWELLVRVKEVNVDCLTTHGQEMVTVNCIQ